MQRNEKIFTLPNLLSLFLIALIPMIIKLYCVDKSYHWALLVLILSGITDVADGIIARKFDMVSDLGKILDPVADKLTQMATLVCLLTRFPYVWIPLALLTVKELSAGIMGLCAIQKSGEVKGADWHGKVCTVMLYAAMGLHILWSGIPLVLSKLLMSLCMATMVLSGVLYWYRNFKQIRGFD